MEIMLDNIIGNLNIVYIFMCNIITYLIIRIIPKEPSTGWKRAISTVVAILLGFSGIYWLDYDKEAVFCSFFVQFLMYDYVIKWFLTKFDPSYKKDIVAGDKTPE